MSWAQTWSKQTGRYLWTIAWHPFAITVGFTVSRRLVWVGFLFLSVTVWYSPKPKLKQKQWTAEESRASFARWPS